MKIMIVEDDGTLAKEIAAFLIKWGYETVAASDFTDILALFLKESPQLILLDVNLPYYDGFYWCSRIRDVSKVPVIFISSRDDDRDQIMGIAQGADDYVGKPFHLEMLKAKIDAILRRTYQYKVKEQICLDHGLSFDVVSQILFCNGKEVELTRSERKIFAKLLENRPDVVFRDTLMMDLWNTNEYVSDGTLTTVISRMRSKLKAACGDEVVNTKKGQGYFIK